MVRHLNAFHLDLKLSVGVWYLSPGGSRFHEPYLEAAPVADRIKPAYDLAEARRVGR
jgi:xylose isomerase